MEWSDIFTKYDNNLQNILKNIDDLREQLKPVEIYPSQDTILKAFDICPFNKIKIVIIGQDPYHGINQATGLCFGVQKNNKFPPSLKNINQELKNDLKTDIKDSTLDNWGQQGVFLGYHTQPGGRWSGAFYVVPLSYFLDRHMYKLHVATYASCATMYVLSPRKGVRDTRGLFCYDVLCGSYAEKKKHL